MYQCISDRHDPSRGIYATKEAFVAYCNYVLKKSPVLQPDGPGADHYYGFQGFVLIKIKEGDIVKTMG
jgi:hypothetical protein